MSKSKPSKRNSWTLTSPSTAEKTLDKSTFDHQGTAIPKGLREFFDFSASQKFQDVTFRCSGKDYSASLFYTQEIDRLKLRWKQDLAQIITDFFPSKESSNGMLRIEKISKLYFDLTLVRKEQQSNNDSILHDGLLHIMAGLNNGATKEPYPNHPLAYFLRHDLTTCIESAISKKFPTLSVSTSAGAGRWAHVVWGAILDPLVTLTATQGYYLVYLFHPKGEKVYLSLNQGTTAVVEEFKKDGNKVLQERASLIRRRLKDILPRHIVTSIDLGTPARLPTQYESGHAIGFEYHYDKLPCAQQLQDDLLKLCGAYKTLTFRGGLGGSIDESEEYSDLPPSALTERRKYSLHRKIDRNSRLIAQVKKLKGYKCEVCGMSFEEKYGPLGKEYIEAHHLVPVATLEEGIDVPHDPKKDFSVLCANCHRMIHRLDDPSDISNLKNIINA